MNSLHDTRAPDKRAATADDAPESPRGDSGLLPPTDANFGAPAGYGVTLSAYLMAVPPPREGPERNDYYHYDLTFDDEPIVVGSRTPEFDACRILLARGLTGKLAIFDAITKKLRLTADIEAGAKLTVHETGIKGSRFAAWKSFSFEKGSVR